MEKRAANGRYTEAKYLAMLAPRVMSVQLMHSYYDLHTGFVTCKTQYLLCGSIVTFHQSVILVCAHLVSPVCSKANSNKVYLALNKSNFSHSDSKLLGRAN